MANETREQEHERIRRSNDRDQEAEREGNLPPHDRGYDEAVRGETNQASDDTAGLAGDVDPDSAESEVDRDDTEAD